MFRVSYAALLAVSTLVAGAVVTDRATPTISAQTTPTQDQTTLDDQVELALTVYNSDIALVRDVRNLQLARGTSNLRFMDIAATVNPATVHFRSLSEPSRISVLEQNYEYRPPRTGQAPPQVRRPGRHARSPGAAERRHAAGGSEGSTPELQQRAGVADRQRDRDRYERRSHPLPGVAGQLVLTAYPDLDARQRRNDASSGRGVVPRRQTLVERRLRADGRARRQVGGHRRLGHADQRQRHVFSERQAAIRRG